MRMWNVDPKLMCQRHLLGEHVEMHMFVGTLKKSVSIQGYLDNGLVNPGQIKKRHDILVQEMKRRGFNHRSPIEFEPRLGDPTIRVDPINSLAELATRCPDCRKLQEDHVSS